MINILPHVKQICNLNVYFPSFSKFLDMKQPWLDSSWDMEVTVKTENETISLAKSAISPTMNTTWEISDEQVSGNLLCYV